jgi:hypothetical protein
METIIGSHPLENRIKNREMQGLQNLIQKKKLSQSDVAQHD